jgi:hypothetical protein
MVQDLKKRDMIRESMTKERFDNSGIANLYADGMPPHVEKEKNLYP